MLGYVPCATCQRPAGVRSLELYGKGLLPVMCIHGHVTVYCNGGHVRAEGAVTCSEIYHQHCKLFPVKHFPDSVSIRVKG